MFKLQAYSKFNQLVIVLTIESNENMAGDLEVEFPKFLADILDKTETLF